MKRIVRTNKLSNKTGRKIGRVRKSLEREFPKALTHPASAPAQIVYAGCLLRKAELEAVLHRLGLSEGLKPGKLTRQLAKFCKDPNLVVVMSQDGLHFLITYKGCYAGATGHRLRKPNKLSLGNGLSLASQALGIRGPIWCIPSDVPRTPPSRWVE